MPRRVRTVHRQKTKTDLVAEVNRLQLEQYGEYGKARTRLGLHLLKDIDWLYDQAKMLIVTDEVNDRMSRYLMLKSLLDKIAPDRKEVHRADVNPKGAPVMIQVNGLNRGTVEARDAALARGANVVTIEAEG